MPAIARRVYVISDLHLGGVYPDPGRPDDRGFRICTHVAEVTAFVAALTAKPKDPLVELVINGDLVDFLAEREPGGWSPFTADPAAAVAKLQAIMGRDRAFFDALKAFLASGRRLVILLGNHDIELGLPPVRRALRAALGAEGVTALQFIYDGEAYIAGDALIEHGNRYDQWNVVDYDGLRRLRSLLSRRQPVPDKYRFVPPAGSHMVVDVVNPIKEDYRFIDLLKPESGAMVPLLLALEPGYRPLLARSAGLALKTRSHRLEAAALPSFGGDISSEVQPVDFGGDMGGVATAPPPPRPAAGPDPLQAVLAEALGPDAAPFLASVHAGATAAIGSDISAMDTIDRTLGLIKIVLGKAHSDYHSRLPALLKALRALQDDKTFDPSVETAPEYLNAAKDLAREGIRHVVFGHTHLPKQIPLDGGGFYLNSGTWADVLQFPSDIVSGPEAAALPRLEAFVKAVAANDFSAWTLFQPTYVRLDLGADDTVSAAELCRYSGPEAV